MLDIEVLSILKIIYEVIDSQQASRKFYSQIAQPADISKCKMHTVEDHRTRRGDTTKPTNVNTKDLGPAKT